MVLDAIYTNMQWVVAIDIPHNLEKAFYLDLTMELDRRGYCKDLGVKMRVKKSS